MFRPCPSLADLPAPPAGREGWPWTRQTPEPAAAPAGGEWPALSVIMPSFNSGAYFEEAVRAVLLQGYPALEFIIMDGGSTDETVETAERYAAWLPGFVSEPDRGQTHAVNKAIARAKGDLLYWCNADDICQPGAMLAAAEALAGNPECGLASGNAMYVDPKGREISREEAAFSSWEDYVFRRCMIRQWCTVFRRRVLRQAGGLDEGLQYSMDRDLLMKVTRVHRPLLLPDYICAYRVHDQAKTRRGDNVVERIRESDRLSLGFLSGRQKAEFKKWRAFSWLEFSARAGLGFAERLHCLARALSLSPRVAATQDFAAAVGGLLKGVFKP